MGLMSESYHNMLMKRSLRQSRHPKVVVLDNTKWLKGFEREECFPVCGDHLDWFEICIKKPIAFAIGINNGDMDAPLWTRSELMWKNAASIKSRPRRTARCRH